MTDGRAPAEVLRFVETYCLDCHSGEAAEGDAPLDQLQEASSPPLWGTWRTVARNLATRRMPPADAPQPADATRQATVAAIQQFLEQMDCSGPVHPGNVTIRRLTRYEYQNTIRDLLGIHYEPATEFPADDVGLGFDNIGDVLTMSPLLAEKYLEAAESIAARVTGPAGQRFRRELAGAEMRGGDFGVAEGDSHFLSSEGVLESKVHIPVGGTFRLQIHGRPEQAGPHWVQVGLLVDAKLIEQFEIREPTDQPFQVEILLPLEAGERALGVAYLNDYFQPEASDPADRDRNVSIDRVVLTGPLDVARPTNTAWQRLTPVRPSASISRDRALARNLVTLLRDTYRRPATRQERQRVFRIVQSQRQPGELFEADLRRALSAALIAPQFLFRYEAPAEPDSVRELTDFELATRLSYFLWSSMPDEQLFERAAKGRLASVSALRSEARRMLRDRKATALVEHFFEQWLQLPLLDKLEMDDELFPSFNKELVHSMRKETHLFVASIIQEDRSVLDLLDADYSFVDPQLAELYDLPALSHDGFQRVSLQSTPRSGILSQASILAITSRPRRTSPVLRGKWILDTVLNDPPPPPLPDVPPLEDQPPAHQGETLRQQLERHRRDPQCAACHERMDALGFSLENFDAIGRYRNADQGVPVDVQAQLPDGTTLQGPDELRRVLREQYADQFVRSLVEKMFVYALGRSVEDDDECTIRQMVRIVRSKGDRFQRTGRGDRHQPRLSTGRGRRAIGGAELRRIGSCCFQLWNLGAANLFGLEANDVWAISNPKSKAMYTHPHRRQFLQTVGATIALPFLDSLTHTAYAASAMAASPPRRLAFLYIPNGTHMPAWRPPNVGPLTDLPASFAEFTDLRDDLLFLSGLELRGAEAQGTAPEITPVPWPPSSRVPTPRRPMAKISATAFRSISWPPCTAGKEIVIVHWNWGWKPEPSSAAATRGTVVPIPRTCRGVRNRPRSPRT